MEKVVEYQNWSVQIFEGFYESLLWDSDAVYHLCECEPEPPAGYEYDMRDFGGYCDEITRRAVELIWDAIPEEDGIILDMKYTGLSSPSYYNFTTDKLCADITVDYDKLKNYCLVEKRKDFDEYLHETFTSYDGFISFVDNNVHDFEMNLEEESEKYDQVMIEFYLLNLDYMQERNCDLSPYTYDLIDYVYPAQWNRLCLYKKDDGTYWDYTVSDDESEVIVGRQFNKDEIESMPKL